MATWIVHLRLAEALLDPIGGLDAAAFALGNIAPDSGIPDEKWEKFTPPPEVTHFAGSTSGGNLADLDFYRRYLAGADRAALGAARFSFLWGYFCHLVTDNLWAQQIGRPTQARFASEFAGDAQFIWKIKEDWYGLDYIYVRDHPASLFWRVFRNCTVSQSYLDFLPLEALRQRVEYIQAMYQRHDAEVQAAYLRPYIYLSQSEVDRFVAGASQQLYRIYQSLWLDHANPNGFSSVLDLLKILPQG
jgi:hypothetical protein